MLVQLLLSLGLLVLASDPILAAAKKRNQREETQLGMAMNDSRILNREEECPPHCPHDCTDLYNTGHVKDGPYIIYISRPKLSMLPAQVYCEMQASCGGWTVFQRRTNGALDFYLDWVNYEKGFGVVWEEHWLGLNKLHLILAQKNYRLRVDMADFNGRTAYAEYRNFTIGSTSNNYTLGLDAFERGTAGDSMIRQTGNRWDLRGMMFSTKDQDNDKWPGADCAGKHMHGAWWYNDCAGSNLNGLYNTDVGQWSGQNVYWYSFNSAYPLKSVSMKFRPM